MNLLPEHYNAATGLYDLPETGTQDDGEPARLDVVLESACQWQARRLPAVDEVAQEMGGLKPDLMICKKGDESGACVIAQTIPQHDVAEDGVNKGASATEPFNFLLQLQEADEITLCHKLEDGTAHLIHLRVLAREEVNRKHRDKN